MPTNSTKIISDSTVIDGYITICANCNFKVTFIKGSTKASCANCGMKDGCCF